MPVEALAKSGQGKGEGFYVKILLMQTISQFCQQLGLNEDQSAKVASYVSDLAIELLQSIKEDNIRNFDETIDNLKSTT